MSFRKQLDYQIVTLGELEEANEQTIDELERHGFYDERMAAIEVYLALAADAFGWQNYGGNGRIKSTYPPFLWRVFEDSSATRKRHFATFSATSTLMRWQTPIAD
jgi:hypothetical protein